jgi:hypothetical protein
MVLSDSSDEEEQRQPKKTTKSAPAHTLSDDEDFATQVSVVFVCNEPDFLIVFFNFVRFVNISPVLRIRIRLDPHQSEKLDPDPHQSVKVEA